MQNAGQLHWRGTSPAKAHPDNAKATKGGGPRHWRNTVTIGSPSPRDHAATKGGLNAASQKEHPAPARQMSDSAGPASFGRAMIDKSHCIKTDMPLSCLKFTLNRVKIHASRASHNPNPSLQDD